MESMRESTGLGAAFASAMLSLDAPLMAMCSAPLSLGEYVLTARVAAAATGEDRKVGFGIRSLSMGGDLLAESPLGMMSVPSQSVAAVVDVPGGYGDRHRHSQADMSQPLVWQVWFPRHTVDRAEFRAQVEEFIDWPREESRPVRTTPVTLSPATGGKYTTSWKAPRAGWYRLAVDIRGYVGDDEFRLSEKSPDVHLARVPVRLNKVEASWLTNAQGVRDRVRVRAVVAELGKPVTIRRPFCGAGPIRLTTPEARPWGPSAWRSASSAPGKCWRRSCLCAAVRTNKRCGRRSKVVRLVST